MKYFHHFENGNCYEFSMGLGTTDDTVAGLKPVNRSLVFGRMEQMLASVKLQPVSGPRSRKRLSDPRDRGRRQRVVVHVTWAHSPAEGAPRRSGAQLL